MKRTPLKRKAPNPRTVANNAANKKQRRKVRAEKGVWPDRDPEYLAWIREHRCILCEDMIERRAFTVEGQPWRQSSATEAAHIGERGLGQKASDYDVLPLCGAYHHRLGRYSHHRLGKKFCEYHELNHAEVVKGLNQRYAARLASEGREAPVQLWARLAQTAILECIDHSESESGSRDVRSKTPGGGQFEPESQVVERAKVERS